MGAIVGVDIGSEAIKAVFAEEIDRSEERRVGKEC